MARALTCRALTLGLYLSPLAVHSARGGRFSLHAHRVVFDSALLQAQEIQAAPEEQDPQVGARVAYSFPIAGIGSIAEFPKRSGHSLREQGGGGLHSAHAPRSSRAGQACARAPKAHRPHRVVTNSVQLVSQHGTRHEKA